MYATMLYLTIVMVAAGNFLISVHGTAINRMTPNDYEVIHSIQEIKQNQNETVSEYLLSTESNKFHLKLQKSRNIISPNFFETFNDGKHKNLKKDHDCYYQGNLGDGDGRVSLSYCNGQMNGMIMDESKGKVFHVEYQPEKKQHIVYEAVDGDQMRVTGKRHADDEMLKKLVHNETHRERRRRNVADLSDTTKYVSLAMVLDRSKFVQLNEDHNEALRFVFTLINHVDFVYSQTKIRIILTNLEIWEQNDKFTVTSTASDNLGKFSQYEGSVLRQQDNWNYDSAQFLTAVHQDNGLVGLAGVGTLCVSSNAVAFVYDWSNNPLVTANTVAHEFGHNLGLWHTNDDCKCDKSPCVMTSYVSWLPIKGIADCSAKAIEERCRKGFCSCLTDQPQTTVEGQVCGNGIVESGEECDCGKPEYCTNPCCDASTCKLTPSSECATGECCNQCKITTRGTPCRNSASECDISESCDGENSVCPLDVHLEDFTSCENEQSYCHRGACVPSLTDQCKKLWGPNALHGECTGKNLVGYKWGHCGQNNDGTYIPCQKQDEQCGKLQCHGDGLSNLIIFGGSRSTLLYTTTSVKCRSGTTSVGKDAGDPTLPLHGTMCGSGKLCNEHQKCVDPSTLRSSSSCSESCGIDGRCTSVGTCYCPAGLKCPDCRQSDVNNVNGMICPSPPALVTKQPTTPIPTTSSSSVALPYGARASVLVCPSTRKLQRVGCRERSGKYLTSFRSNIDWKNFKTFAEDMICKCASIARKKGFVGFGIVYWGECWGYRKMADIKKTPTSRSCRSDRLMFGCRPNDQLCVGTKSSSSVYVMRSI